MSEIFVSLIDKSPAMRKLIAKALRKISSVKVVSSAENFEEGLTHIRSLRPDMIFTEYASSGLRGLDLIRSLRVNSPSSKIVLVTTMSREEILTKDPLVLLDIYDYIRKPDVTLDSTKAFEKLLSEFQKLFFKLLVGRVKIQHRVDADGIIAVGASTGGPEATIEFLRGLSKDISSPIVIAIHMPENFTKSYAERLSRVLGRPVSEAVDGLVVKPGDIWIAPGNYHLFLEKKNGLVYLRTNQMPMVNSCRPSVDSLFASLPECYGSKVTVVILTGMGADGLEGAKIVHNHGGVVFAQDSESSKVWGMPQTVIMAGIATQVGTPVELAKALIPASKAA